MKVKEVVLSKQFKIGLPNFSNQTIGVFMTWELDENEEFDFDDGWRIINHQLDTQASGGTDAPWINTKEYTKHYSTTIKTKK